MKSGTVKISFNGTNCTHVFTCLKDLKRLMFRFANMNVTMTVIFNEENEQQ